MLRSKDKENINYNLEKQLQQKAKSKRRERENEKPICFSFAARMRSEICAAWELQPERKIKGDMGRKRKKGKKHHQG